MGICFILATGEVGGEATGELTETGCALDEGDIRPSITKQKTKHKTPKGQERKKKPKRRCQTTVCK